MNPTKLSSKETRFDWPLCHDAENFILSGLEAFTKRNSFARRLEERMRSETGTLLLDWVDHVIVPRPEQKAVRALGFVEDPLGETPAHLEALWHPEAMLPRVLLERESRTAVASPAIVALRCESIADFIVAHGLTRECQGTPLSRYRRQLVS